MGSIVLSSYCSEQCVCQVRQVAALAGLKWARFNQGLTDDSCNLYFSLFHEARQRADLEQEDKLFRNRFLYEDEGVIEALHVMNLSSRLLEAAVADSLRSQPQA